MGNASIESIRPYLKSNFLVCTLNIRPYSRLMNHVVNTFIKAAVSKLDRFDKGLLSLKYSRDPDPVNISTTFKDLCYTRAEDLINIGKPILIFSSGGVDSLTVISSFLHCGTKPTVVQVGTEEELENPIIKRLKDLGVDYRAELDLTKYNTDDYTVVSGQCGDQVDSCCCENHKAIELGFNYLDALEMAKSDDFFNTWINHAVVPIKTDEQILWYISYAIKWRICKYLQLPRFLLNFGYNVNYDTYESFFGTNDFSDWVYSNYDRIWKDTEYKTRFKDIIKEHIDPDQIALLDKDPSIFHAYNALLGGTIIKEAPYALYIDESSGKHYKININSHLGGR